MRLRYGIVLAVAAACGARGVVAQEALYGKQPPPGSAFIRLVNTTPQALVVGTNLRGDVALGTAAQDRVAPYAVMENAAGRTLALTVGQARFSYHAQPDTYVTLAFGLDGSGAPAMTPIVDKADFNQARARLAFYNLAPDCASASLALDPGGQAIFADVGLGTTKSRSVNPVQASVKASCAGGASPSLALGGMEVGSSYSIWLEKSGQGDVLMLTKDATARYDPKG